MIQYNHIISFIELCVIQGLGILLKRGWAGGKCNTLTSLYYDCIMMIIINS